MHIKLILKKFGLVPSFLKKVNQNKNILSTKVIASFSNKINKKIKIILNNLINFINIIYYSILTIEYK